MICLSYICMHNAKCFYFNKHYRAKLCGLSYIAAGVCDVILGGTTELSCVD